MFYNVPSHTSSHWVLSHDSVRWARLESIFPFDRWEKSIPGKLQCFAECPTAHWQSHDYKSSLLLPRQVLLAGVPPPGGSHFLGWAISVTHVVWPFPDWLATKQPRLDSHSTSWPHHRWQKCCFRLPENKFPYNTPYTIQHGVQRPWWGPAWGRELSNQWKVGATLDTGKLGNDTLGIPV